MLPLDTTLQKRSQKLQARRQDVRSALTGLRNKWEVSANHLTATHIAKFTRALKARLLDTASGFGEAYLNLLVDEIRLDGSKLHIKGSYSALARAITLSKEGKLGMVPSFVPDWRPHGMPINPTYRVGVRGRVTAAMEAGVLTWAAPPPPELRLGRSALFGLLDPTRNGRIRHEEGFGVTSPQMTVLLAKPN